MTLEYLPPECEGYVPDRGQNTEAKLSVRRKEKKKNSKLESAHEAGVTQPPPCPWRGGRDHHQLLYLPPPNLTVYHTIIWNL